MYFEIGIAFICKVSVVGIIGIRFLDKRNFLEFVVEYNLSAITNLEENL